jgi:hypothetical protein
MSSRRRDPAAVLLPLEGYHESDPFPELLLMTEAAETVLTAFDRLPPADQHTVAVEILRRSAGTDDLTETALTGLADDLFRSYDAEETAHADSSQG